MFLVLKSVILRKLTLFRVSFSDFAKYFPYAQRKREIS